MKKLMFAVVAMVAVVSVAVAAMEIALSSQQDADARGCSGTNPAFNASKGRCFHPSAAEEAEEAEESDNEDE